MRRVPRGARAPSRWTFTEALRKVRLGDERRQRHIAGERVLVERQDGRRQELYHLSRISAFDCVLHMLAKLGRQVLAMLRQDLF